MSLAHRAGVERPVTAGAASGYKEQARTNVVAPERRAGTGSDELQTTGEAHKQGDDGKWQASPAVVEDAGAARVTRPAGLRPETPGIRAL